MASALLAPKHEDSPVSRPVCVIATYNERTNVEQLLPQILRADERLRVLVVDDASADGTATAVERVGEKWPGRVDLIRRPAKMGYGSAFVDVTDASESSLQVTSLGPTATMASPMWI